MAQGLFSQIKSHFILGKKHGVTKKSKCRNNWNIHHATSGGG